MAKFVWQDGTLVSKAKVEIGGTIYEVDPEEYSGSTPLSASNLNAMVDSTYSDLKDYADNIIESGTGYVKYADGTMICYYTKDITTSINITWGNLYLSSALTLDDFAQTFLATPCVQINVTGGNSSAFVVNATASSTTNPGKIHLSRPQTDTSKTYTINVMAIGRWK